MWKIRGSSSFGIYIYIHFIYKMYQVFHILTGINSVLKIKFEINNYFYQVKTQVMSGINVVFVVYNT